MPIETGGEAPEEQVGGSIGTGIGTAIGGPIGGAIGGVIGSAVGGVFGKKKKKQAPVTANIASFPCPKVTDKGISKAWWWADLIAQAVAVWSAVETYKAASEQEKIGRAYYNMAKEQWAFFENYYKPLEQQELAEIKAEMVYMPDYPTAIKGHTHLVDNVFSSADRHRQALAAKYCICADVSQFTISDLMQSTVMGDSDNFARRYAGGLTQERNDTRWARRIAAASRGRGLLSDSTSFASKASGYFGDYARSMSGFSKSAAQFSGYIQNRNETLYNEPRQRIDSRAYVPNTSNADVDTQGYWDSANLRLTQATGGLSWETTEGKTPFIHSGLDPSGYANVDSNVR